MSKIIPRLITEEMKRSYLDYSMSVIVARALPDVRDGLKPVQRRIIYTMHKLGLTAQAKFAKSAKVVGEVLGKYHPHGDVPVYEALVRMAQDFSMRYTLIKGQGNFGSIDGDPPAAMRYTEIKLEKITEELLQDINKETVPFRDNFDASLKEPEYLPAKIPALLLNGAEGIAVGMATKIPPHNITEVLSALIYLVDTHSFDEKLAIDEAAKIASFSGTLEGILEYIKGPDFPTGGIIYSREDIKLAYATGRNSILMRGVAEIEETGKNKQAIVITELPYQVNKADLVQRIAELVNEKKISGISDLRDESDREGIRVVIELKRDAAPKKILNNLYLHTQLQTSFPVNMVALVDNVPQTLPLKTILEHFLRHRAQIVIYRSRYDLKIARERAHILEGLLIAIDNIDEIIAIIKKSENEAVARERLIKRFAFSNLQAQAILDMQLKKLTALEKDKVLTELKGLKNEIARLEKLLSSLKYIFAAVKQELVELKEKYADKRLTKIVVSRPGEFTEEQLIQNKETYILLTENGYIKQLPKASFKVQKRGGKGITAIKTNTDDAVKKIEFCNTHDNLLFFTNSGRVFQIKAWDVPETSRHSKGKAIVNLINLQPNEKISTFFSYNPAAVEDIKNTFVFFVTKKGVVKKTELTEYTNIRSNGLIAIKLPADDSVESVEFVKKDDLVFLVSVAGKAITFPQANVRAMGRAAQGVRGIRLKKNEYVTSMSIINKEKIKESLLLIVTKHGFGKLVHADKFRSQNRGGVGLKAANITEKTGPIIFSEVVQDLQDTDLILTSAGGHTVKLPLKSLRILSRTAQGVILMRFSNAKDYVATAAIV